MSRTRTPSNAAPVRLTLRTKYWFEVGGRFAIGEGGIELLRAVACRGSLARAAQDVGWSYRHAWGYLRRAEAALAVHLTLRRPGKGAKRGLDLTTEAKALIARATGLRRRSTLFRST